MEHGFVVAEIVLDGGGRTVDYRMIELNPPFERLTGQSRELFLGGRTVREVAPELEQHWYERYGRVALTRQPERFDFDAAGWNRWFDVYAFPIGPPELLRVAILFTEVTDRKRAKIALRESEASLVARVDAATSELRTLSRRLFEVQEDERRPLSRELHDEVGQVLTGLQFQLATIASADSDRLAEAQRTVQDLTEQIRQLSMDLRPAVLDQYGLLAALRWHMERYGAGTGIKVDLRHEGLDMRQPPQIEIAAFRVVQEALTNIARHAASARKAFVQLLADALTIVVRDRGQGFDPLVVNPSGGLSGMRERIALLGGTLTIETSAGAGTVIAAEVPLVGNSILEVAR
jgi:PAS domain S-box-containing protein